MTSFKKLIDTPKTRLFTILSLGFLISAVIIELALLQPKLNYKFEAGQTLKTASHQFVIEPLDLTSEPGEILKNEDLWRFYSRQNEISRITSEETFIVEKNGSSSRVNPTKRTIADLSILFWIQIFVGFGALTISGGIWALRSRDLAATFFAASGFSTFLSAVTAAVYTTRDLAMATPLFRILQELNALGAIFFGISMIALFCTYPVRVFRWRTIIVLQSFIFSIAGLLFAFKISPDWGHVNFIMVLEMLLICLAIGFQFWLTRKNPKARASLIWLGLSVILGAGAFILFNTVPLVLNITPLNQGYAFLFFLIIYIGLAAGLTQFRLFDVGQWAFRFLFYALGAIVLVIFDASLVYFVGLDRAPALGFSLLVIGFIYLPLRDSVWYRFSKFNRLKPHELLNEALYVALASSSERRSQRWEDLLRKLFDPLEVNANESTVTQVEFSFDGLSMYLPPVAGASSLKLSYPDGGRSLFTSETRLLAQQIVVLIEQVDTNRDSYDRGVLEERRRMAQDLHDNVGARLLSALHIADEKMRPLLQDTMADIRSIVSVMSGEKMTLDQLLADVRAEAFQRLEKMGIKINWPISNNTGQLLTYSQQKTLRSVFREVISNVIRHSKATQFDFKIKMNADFFEIFITDNGLGFSPEVLAGEISGHGLKNLRQRLQDIRGEFHFSTSETGASIRISIPLEKI